MKYRKTIIFISLTVLLIAFGFGYGFYNTYKNYGPHAISKMTNEEKEWLDSVVSISINSTREEIYRQLGMPTNEESYQSMKPDIENDIVSNWFGFLNYRGNQLIIKFYDDKPHELTWFKWGYFGYDVKL